MDPNIPNQPFQNETPPVQPNPLSEPIIQQPVIQQPPIQQAPVPQQPANEPPSPGIKLKWILFIIILVVVVGGGIYYLNIRQNKQNQQNKQNKKTAITQTIAQPSPTPTVVNLNPNTGNLYNDIQVRLNQVIK
jgi:hypothetical protein